MLLGLMAVITIAPDYVLGASSIFGTTGTGPAAITIDSAGNIYTANYNSNNVTKITPNGTTTTPFGGPIGANPAAITIDSAGNIYITSNLENTVTKITPDGTTTPHGTGTGTNPVGITIDSAGNIYTANEGPDTVTKITPDGTTTPHGTETGLNPAAITIDSAGNIYTANYGSGNVTKITPSGITTIFGTTGSGSSPAAITIDSAGNIYTANSGLGTVTKITPAGVSSILGTTAPGTNPVGITIDSTGGVYTANQGSSNVTKITSPPDAPTSVAGASGNGQVVVSWNAPVRTGGSTITAYTVTASPGGQTCGWSSGALSCTITGLTNGTSYTFTVTATNAEGTSSPSLASSAVTPDVPLSAVAATIQLKIKISTKGSIIFITITARGPGRLAVIGTIQTRAKVIKVCSATKKVKKAGKVTLTCKLSKAARTARHKHALKVLLTTTFTPTTGVKAVSVKTITLKRR